jgi:hypothetical protein
MIRETVLKAIKFNREFCVGTVKIQNVLAQRVLPAKLKPANL